MSVLDTLVANKYTRRKIPEVFIEECLKAHNQYRAIHETPPLRIDGKLNDHAQEWADNLAKEGVVTQRTLVPYGESVYVEVGPTTLYKLSPRKPVDYWYREGKFYKYGVTRPGNLKDVRHFTQILWRATKSMGLGMAVGSDGKIYVVCNYEPAGNVEGEFADNVMPPKDEKIDLPPIEEVGIKFIEPRLDIVKSMERLYSVPSEKLRVWSVWLSKVGEIGDEWHKFLRLHLDLLVRLSERLKAIEEDERSQKTASLMEKKLSELEPAKQAFSDETYTTALDVEISTDMVADFSRGSLGTDVAKTASAVDDAESGHVSSQQMPEAEEISATTTNDEAPKMEGNEQNDQEGRSLEDNEVTGFDAEESEDGVVEDKKDTESVVYTERSWPIGRPWRPVGTTEKETMEKIKPLDLPNNEEEMMMFIENFTQQATIYRSYYKHWRETADQAIKEVGARTVMPTFKVRGMVVPGKVDGVDLPVPKYSSPTDRKTSARKSLRTSSQKPGISKMDQKKATEEAKVDPETDEPKEESSETDQFFTPEGSRTETPPIATDVSNPPESAARTTETIAGLTSGERLETIKNTEIAKVEDCIRDWARANEDIPYFFYVKAEPDYGIAIEHDDKAVIPDPNRESIIGNYKRLFFNLEDKPGRGASPAYERSAL